MTITNSVITSNKAKGGSGGFFYMPVTSLDSTIVISSTTFGANLALNDGGIFYIAGAATAKKILKMSNLV